jgi:hypothetical protein
MPETALITMKMGARASYVEARPQTLNASTFCFGLVAKPPKLGPMNPWQKAESGKRLETQSPCGNLLPLAQMYP